MNKYNYNKNLGFVHCLALLTLQALGTPKNLKALRVSSATSEQKPKTFHTKKNAIYRF